MTNNNAILPGTTYPTNTTATKTGHRNHPPPDAGPTSSAGPSINGKPTTLTLYEPSQLVNSPLISSLYTVINTAFATSHAQKCPFSADVDRLLAPEDYLSQLGTDPGTFAYMLTWPGTDQVVGTVSAHRYVAPVVVAEAIPWERGSTFKRLKSPVADSEAESAEVWELKFVAVDVALQGQGLATYLMDLADGEVKRRFLATASPENGARKPAKKLWMVLTTVRECNGRFYARRGYAVDGETWHEPGFLGSEGGFHIVHMSKVLDV